MRYKIAEGAKNRTKDRVSQITANMYPLKQSTNSLVAYTSDTCESEVNFKEITLATVQKRRKALNFVA